MASVIRNLNYDAVGLTHPDDETWSEHPVSGEEAFIVHRTPDGEVWLTLRSLTRASRGRWWWAFPVLLVAQKYYRRRDRLALKAT